MAEFTDNQPQKLSWRFPRAFWIGNCAELFERAAFYGMFIALALYLTRRIGFTDVGAGYLAAGFSSVIYLLPTFLGAMADKIGFRRALILAFALLTAGYSLLGMASWAPTGSFACQSTAVVSLLFVMVGGAIVKPVISGTVAKCSDEAHRARAFSIFYQVVNIGAFFGKTIAKPLRTGIDLPYFGRFELGLQYINFYAALMAFCALLFVVLFYRNVDAAGTGKSAREAWEGMKKVIRNGRFISLILIVAGFWVIQGQLYASMPKYILRLIGESAVPEYLANINPFVVVVCVLPITHLIRHFKPANAIAIGLAIIPISAVLISLSPVLQRFTGDSVGVFGRFALHPLTVMVIFGIAFQGLAECFLSPKFLEYASRQAPKGEEGLYLGYQNLTTFFAWALGFGVSGHLLERFCPDPRTLSPDDYRVWARGTDTGFLFELDESVASELKAGSLQDSPLRDVLEKHDIAVHAHSKINSANLDGTNVSIVDAERYRYPEAIAVDGEENQLYWVDAFENKAYHAEFGKDADAGGRSVDATKIEELELSDQVTPCGIAADPEQSRLYFVDRQKGSIFATSVRGFDEKLIIDGLDDPRDVAVDWANGVLYWTQADGVWQTSLNLAKPELFIPKDDAGDPAGIAIDPQGKSIYWIDRSLGAIRAASLDGSDVRTVVADAAVRGVALDPRAKRIYWTAYDWAELVAAGDGWQIDAARGTYEIREDGDAWVVRKAASPLPAQYRNAHYIWYCFAAIGITAFLAMLVYRSVTERMDRTDAAAS